MFSKTGIEIRIPVEVSVRNNTQMMMFSRNTHIQEAMACHEIMPRLLLLKIKYSPVNHFWAAQQPVCSKLTKAAIYHGARGGHAIPTISCDLVTITIGGISDRDVSESGTGCRSIKNEAKDISIYQQQSTLRLLCDFKETRHTIVVLATRYLAS